MKPVYVVSALVALLLLAGTYGLVGYFSGDDQLHPDTNVQIQTAAADSYRSGPFLVQIEPGPETPVVGENTLKLVVRDTDNNPVAGLEINAYAQMPAMGSMPAMRAPVEFIETAPGSYAGRFTIPMGGAWPLTLTLEKPGMGSTRMSFEMNTRSRGLKAVSGGNEDAAGAGLENATVYIDNRRRQAIGLKTGVVTREVFSKTVRAVGKVTYDETRLSDITLRFDAWVGELNADYTGKDVLQGETLFSVYSPELLAAQLEYIEALKRDTGKGGSLIAAARMRLVLLGMDDTLIRLLEQGRSVQEYIPVIAPRTGTVVEKHIVEGTAHKAGVNMLRIADLSVVWLEADVYESELGLVTPGMEAQISFPDLPGRSFSARVDYIYPYLDGDTRTGRVRLLLDNSAGQFRPEMYAEVSLKADLGERLMIPEEAVLFAGDSRVVFRDLGNGELKPVRIRTGLQSQDFIEVVDGLEEGDAIVTSGTFLIAAESKLKSGINQW